VIIFIGVAGAGKSVQGKMLADHYGMPWISTGELLRMFIAGERRQRMLKGELLTDEELYEVIQPVLKVVCRYGDIVLDGFPRTVPQANWLLEYAQKIKRPIKCIVHLDAPEEVVRERLLSRGRPDDTEEGISARFHEYRKNTLPIIRHYKEIGVPVVNVSGIGEEKNISADIIEKLQKFVS
jgi:adenylate kinase